MSGIFTFESQLILKIIVTISVLLIEMCLVRSSQFTFKINSPVPWTVVSLNQAGPVNLPSIVLTP